ncbi:hypothetical protein [Spiroplasma alleghenense]|uniref:Transmembrane protein n=1 Tax=Spiroplasma alleghenense TaxID=216931 RepID=A0A345Z2D7_9MOLU|nr:hypothetical protein [Spiroplasma alleghenense]AXK50766.1 hypothetical protein SALLE_v1c00900 [Spiroplasma alleghenense]
MLKWSKIIILISLCLFAFFIVQFGTWILGFPEILEYPIEDGIYVDEGQVFGCLIAGWIGIAIFTLPITCLTFLSSEIKKLRVVGAWLGLVGISFWIFWICFTSPFLFWGYNPIFITIWICGLIGCVGMGAGSILALIDYYKKENNVKTEQ